MRDAEAVHCCSVTLIVVGEDLDPEEVSIALGMRPDRSWRRGEQKTYTRSNGDVLRFDSVYEDGGWKRFIPGPYREKALHEQVLLWLAALRKRREALWALRRRGWGVELDCFAAGSEVLVLSNGQLRELADLGIGLALTLARGTERVDRRSE